MLSIEGRDASDEADTESGEQPVVSNEDLVLTSEMADDAWYEPDPSGASMLGKAMPFLAILAIVGWSAFFVFAYLDQMQARPTPAMWTSLVANWAIPPLLIVTVWLLFMRTSKRETGRFTDAARQLDREAAALEERLTVVNGELSLARDFIASQSRDLEALGRVAAERLTSHAAQIESLIVTNNERVRMIGQVSETAVANMERLRGELPVLTTAARDMTSQIGNAGHVAQEQLDALVGGFDKLDELGTASARHVDHVHSRMDEALASFDGQAQELGDAAGSRFEELHRRSEEHRIAFTALEDQTSEALRARADELGEYLQERDRSVRDYEASAIAAMRERLAGLSDECAALFAKLRENKETVAGEWSDTIGGFEERLEAAVAKVSSVDEAAMSNARARLVALHEEANRVDQAIGQSADAFHAELDRRRTLTGEREAEALAALEERLALLDTEVNERHEAQLAHVSGLAERGDALAERLAALDADMHGLGEQADSASQIAGETADILGEKLAQSRAVLEENGTFIARLTDDSVRLLELIRSGAEHSDGALSESIGRAEGRLTAFRENAANLRDTILDAEARGAALAEHLEQSRETGGNSLEVLRSLEAQLDEVTVRSQALAEQTRDELKGAIDMLTMSSSNVLRDVRARQSETVRELAEGIAAESSAAISAALAESAQKVLAELEESTLRASEAGRETTILLRDQLARVNELTGNLEQRVTTARERAEEQKDSDFSRRVALITEALNSSSIDISKAFDTDVGDTQWGNYLRGDRGIFTRRAVQLLDKHEARAVFDVYEEDAEFRLTVNRYIADFEGMLRTILSTRDGNALAVTLLSSDIGKLYVMLAQAIERLRN